MKQIVECIPNFSDGRDAAKLAAIVAAMREVPGVFILGQESDADHNRSVVTLAGEPQAVAEAVVRAVGRAAELIDLTRQTGAHPRIGSTDVVPFVPIRGVTMSVRGGSVEFETRSSRALNAVSAMSRHGCSMVVSGMVSRLAKRTLSKPTMRRSFGTLMPSRLSVCSSWAAR